MFVVTTIYLSIFSIATLHAWLGIWDFLGLCKLGVSVSVDGNGWLQKRYQYA